MITKLAELMRALDGLAMMTGQPGLAQAWEPWKALRDELASFGYPTVEEYETQIKAMLAREIAQALS